VYTGTEGVSENIRAVMSKFSEKYAVVFRKCVTVFNIRAGKSNFGNSFMV
jgi:hypothetical protein